MLLNQNIEKNSVLRKAKEYRVPVSAYHYLSLLDDKIRSALFFQEMDFLVYQELIKNWSSHSLCYTKESRLLDETTIHVLQIVARIWKDLLDLSQW